MNASHRTHLDYDLGQIREDILRLGSQVERHIEWSVQSLRDRNAGLAHRVIEGDARIDTLRTKIELECLASLATQQPTARDLRRILAAMHMSMEMARMADHAKGIAGISLRLGEARLTTASLTLLRMQELACRMLHNALDAFLRTDPRLALEVATRDDALDALYSEALQAALTDSRMGGQPVDQAMYVVWTAHNLERIGDRVTNMCERVVFVSTGQLGDMPVIAVRLA